MLAVPLPVCVPRFPLNCTCPEALEGQYTMLIVCCILGGWLSSAAAGGIVAE